MSSLRPSHAIFAVLKKRSHANLSTNTYNSRIMRVSLAQRPCKYSSNHRPRFSLCSCHPRKGHAALLQNSVCTCHPCTKGHAKSLCAIPKKKKVQLIPCRRENRHSCAGSPIISSAFRGRIFRDIRTFGRAVEGSSVSPLTNTMGDLSGGGRGCDTSGVCSAPSFVIAQLRA